MAFNRSEVSALLAKCHRRCCVCHRYCGVKMETDHIVPRSAGGPDTIDNAIPLCFECHAEIHSYNDSHPRGRKFTPEELKQHKEQWLTICRDDPGALLQAPPGADVGPLQALVDELTFNELVASQADSNLLACRFQTKQFERAIATGSIAVLQDSLRAVILNAYLEIGATNELLTAALGQYRGRADFITRAQRRLMGASGAIRQANNQLIGFLGPEEDGE